MLPKFLTDPFAAFWLTVIHWSKEHQILSTIIVGILAILLWQIVLRYTPSPVPDQQIPNGRAAFLENTARQAKLRAELRKHASERTNVKILFANVKHRPLAEMLISIFSLSGWQTNLTNVPLESYRHEYLAGIEVRGYNEHLVKAVVSAMTESGLLGVRADIRTSEVSRDNPKWMHVQQSIRITIGHEQ